MENLGYSAGLELSFTDLDLAEKTKTTLSDDAPRTIVVFYRQKD